MPLTRDQGKLLSQSFLLQQYLGSMGLVENQETPIGVANCLPFVAVGGDTLRVERAGPINIDGHFFDVPPLTPEKIDTPPEELLEANFPLALLTQDVVVANFVDINQALIQSQLGVQLQAAQKRMVYKYLEMMFEGNSALNPGEFDGLKALATPEQTINTADLNLTLNDLARLQSLNRTNEGFPSAFVTNTTGLKNIEEAHADAGVEMQMCPQSECMRESEDTRIVDGDASALVPCFNGTPILVSGVMKDNATYGSYNAGTIAVISFGAPDGVFAAVSADQPFMTVREVLDSSVTNTIYRLGWSVGMAVGSLTSYGLMNYVPSNSSLQQ
jgi:hypothetical protein